MANETASSYRQVSTRDEEDSDVSSIERAEEHQHGLDEPQSPTSLAGMANVPTVSLSPPVRAETGDSYMSAVSQPISIQSQNDDKKPDNRRHSSLTVLKDRFQGSFTPSLHELLEKQIPDPATRRQYSHKRQRRRLWRLTIGEFVITVAICAIYFAILYVYSKRQTIDVNQRRVFNALTTGVALLLGVNLAASLRSYAKLLRWRMLAICYRPLETFDLVMGCDSLMNVLKLLWKARDHKHKYLPSRTQLLCCVWLLVHLAVTILVGIIGLNYNLDNATNFLLIRNGNTSILDLNYLSSGNYASDLAAVQNWGISGGTATALDLNSDTLEQQNSYWSDSQGWTMYSFQDRNPKDSTQRNLATRDIYATAFCTSHPVTTGQYGNLSYVIYHDGKKEVNQSLPTTVGVAGLLAISKLNSTCGQRCADLLAFQAATLPADEEDASLLFIPEAHIFICNNTVFQVESETDEGLTAEYLVSDLVASMLAGAIGWSDLPPALDGTAEYSVYTNNSNIGFYLQPNEADVASVISEFTMGIVAFLDDAGFYRTNVTGQQPGVAQVLNVKWKFAGSILAALPAIHFLTLICVITWANKAIIKDDSHLAIAKVYHRFLSQLGDRACLLRGDEIVAILQNPSVAYGWRRSTESDGHDLMHVDIFERGRDEPRVEERFREGWYNGKCEDLSTAKPPFKGSLRRRYRDFDATDYF